MKNSSRVILCAVVLSPLAAGAQQLDSLRLGILAREVGSEVRVSTPPAGRIQGRLLEVSHDTLHIDLATGPHTVLFSSRDTLWVRESLGMTGGKIGAAVGLASAGGVLLFLGSTCGSGDDPCTGFGRGALLIGTAGLVFGTGTGLVVGEFIKHWVRKTP